ncbi:hypothetical protein F1D05_14690 [Kribbella qitaiheensis]|uniref:Uncharacterized protein n=1 Tax=Kribbella qitaiheensis TaxID=1544730 RepID=A0A7G6WY65_9ACTN|nr:hypothetical protein [Kribbella qitaiheensis]QNE18930.1 hypothetical protein F1D05_14690 [Kribbella qitaiheensis]
MTLTDFDVLRTLDPATTEIDPFGPRARADLERILATDPALPAILPRRNRRRAVALAVGAVAAATVAALVLPSTLGGDKAFATWVAAPTGLSASESAKAASSCRDARKSSGNAAQLKAATTAISEQRGAWTLVVLAGQNGFSALCITDESTPLFKSNIGSIGSASDADQPGNRRLSATVLGAGSIDGNQLSIAAGAAGSDVAAVTYASATHGVVTATVSGGQFALWFPGNELESRSHNTPVRVTYRDGTTATVVLTL